MPRNMGDQQIGDQLGRRVEISGGIAAEGIAERPDGAGGDVEPRLLRTSSGDLFLVSKAFRLTAKVSVGDGRGHSR